MPTEGDRGGTDRRAAVRVRRWLPGDISAVRDIAWQTWLATYGSFIPVHDLSVYYSVWYAPEALAATLDVPEFTGLLAEVEGTPAGFARVHVISGEGYLSLSSLYVLPEKQGCGAGSALLRAAEAVGRDAGAREVWLGVMVRNTHALEWYRTRGFRFVRLEPFTMGSTTVDHLIGYKSLLTDTLKAVR